MQGRASGIVDLGFSTFFLNRTNRSGIIYKAGPIGGQDQTGNYKIDVRFNKEDLIKRVRKMLLEMECHWRMLMKLVSPKGETFEQNLLEAKRALQKAQSYQTEKFDGTDETMLRLAASVAKIADELYDGMEKKWKSIQDDGTPKKRLFSED